MAAGRTACANSGKKCMSPFWSIVLLGNVYVCVCVFMYLYAYVDT